MGRSVSFATGSVAIAYRMYDGDGLDWDDYAEELRAMIGELFPSMERCNHWLDREDLGIMCNRLAVAGVSEYCGLVSVWLVPYNDDKPELAQHWCEQVKAKFEATMGTINKVGAFSNGEALFEAKRVAFLEDVAAGRV